MSSVLHFMISQATTDCEIFQPSHNQCWHNGAAQSLLHPALARSWLLGKRGHLYCYLGTLSNCVAWICCQHKSKKLHVGLSGPGWGIKYILCCCRHHSWPLHGSDPPPHLPLPHYIPPLCFLLWTFLLCWALLSDPVARCRPSLLWPCLLSGCCKHVWATLGWHTARLGSCCLSMLWSGLTVVC